MNQKICKVLTNGFEISRKVLCLLLACVLLIQTGCQTTKVLKSIEQEDLKTEQHKPLNLKVGQLIRITYLDGSSTKPKRQVGRVKSVTTKTIVLTYNPGFRDKDVSIPFEHIKKIELIKKNISIGEYVAGTIFVLALYVLIELKELE